MTTPYTPQTAQPVNAAKITEADVLAFFAGKEADLHLDHPEAGICYHGNTHGFSVSSYVKEHVFCSGKSIEDARLAYREKMAELIDTPAKLRAQAAAKLAQAAELELEMEGRA
jgi:hypothetical protein